MFERCRSKCSTSIHDQGSAEGHPDLRDGSEDINAVVCGFLRDLAFVQPSRQQTFGYKRAASAILSLGAPVSGNTSRQGDYAIRLHQRRSAATLLNCGRHGGREWTRHYGDVAAVCFSHTYFFRKLPIRVHVSIQSPWNIDSCRSSGNTMIS